MAVGGRHIRHDWQTFVDWEQKSCRTICGKTTTFNAVGIPGVTDQPEEVEVKGKKYYAWCTNCSVLVMPLAERIAAGRVEGIHPYILPMYAEVFRITYPIFLRWQQR